MTRSVFHPVRYPNSVFSLVLVAPGCPHTAPLRDSFTSGSLLVCRVWFKNAHLIEMGKKSGIPRESGLRSERFPNIILHLLSELLLLCSVEVCSCIFNEPNIWCFFTIICFYCLFSTYSSTLLALISLTHSKLQFSSFYCVSATYSSTLLALISLTHSKLHFFLQKK